MERIGPYDLREQLGRGGVGAVFRAVDTRSGREVALKLLAAADERSRRRLLLEARALVLLRHEHIVSLLDAGEDRGRPWLALELVRGRSLQERLDREGPLPRDEAVAVARTIALALHHAHQQGVLHRDVKPANVLLPDDGGGPKLTDFGLAGFAFELSQSRLTRSGALMGSPGYWAPEQASGQASALGVWTDVHGLGALLHACLTGRAPFEGDSLPELLHATLERRPAPPGAGAPLDGIVLRCLEKRPEDRFPSADALARELSRSRTSGRSGCRRSVVGVVAAAVVLAGVVATLAWRDRAESQGGPTSAADLTSATGGAPELASRPELEELLERAARQLDDGRLDEGRAQLDRAIALNPRDPRAYVRRGSLREHLGDLHGALADCNRALELDPRAPGAHFIRGVALARLGESALATADLDRAIELDPDGAALAHYNRGTLRKSRGDQRGALADFDRSLELDPQDASTYVSRAELRLQLRDLEGALADYDRAIELEAPFLAGVHVLRGQVKELLGDDAGAIRDYEHGLQLGPEGQEAEAVRQRIRWLRSAERAGSSR